LLSLHVTQYFNIEKKEVVMG